MNDEEPKSPAELKEIRLNRKLAQDAEGIKAMADIAAADIAIRKRTANLRAIRLAKEAADLANPPEPKVKAKAKPKGGATKPIDLDALRAIGELRGFPTGSKSDLLDVMFRDGVTTREQATETSGRGVGLAAVASACRDAGGTVEVDTIAGKGTLFRFAFSGQPVQVRETKSGVTPFANGSHPGGKSERLTPSTLRASASSASGGPLK